MAYTKPTRTKAKTGKRVKHLTIGNTDKYKNYHTITNQEIEAMVPVNFRNVISVLKDVTKKFNKGIIPTETYRYDMTMTSDVIAEKDVIKIIEMGVPFIYHVAIPDSSDRSQADNNKFKITGSLGVTDNIMDALARSSAETAIMYTYSAYAKPLVSEVEKAHECTKVIFEVPLVVPDMSAHNVVVAFDPYKTNIDEVQIDLPPLKQFEIDGGNADVADIRKRFYINKLDGLWYPATKTKYNLYKSLQREFSDWGTYVTMVCQDEKEREALDKLVAEGK